MHLSVGVGRNRRPHESMQNSKGMRAAVHPLTLCIFAGGPSPVTAETPSAESAHSALTAVPLMVFATNRSMSGRPKFKDTGCKPRGRFVVVCTRPWRETGPIVGQRCDVAQVD